MAAIAKRLLHLRPNIYSYPRPLPYSLHHFSSSSDADDPQPEHEPDPATQTPFSSKFDEVKASLQKEPPTPPQDRRQTPRKPLSFSSRTTQTPPPSRDAAFEEIRRNLSEFRLRSAAPPPSSSGGQYISLQELYKRNVVSGGEGSAASSDSPTENSSADPAAGRKLSFDAIRGSLRHIKAATPAGLNGSGGKPTDPLSIARFRESLKLRPDPNADQDSKMTIVGSDSYPSSFFGKEKRGKGDDNLPGTGYFLRMYDRRDLGKKLKELRPEKRKGKWFSLQELNERLAKLREIEEEESKARLGPVFSEMRDSLRNLDNDDKARKRMMQRHDILGQLGGTPSFMSSPPKEELVEKYFHPDNMSSAEKLKLKLKKVRDEFKMSESDCGSARVQVAQLTTKIKHLSSVLQKKDKHSRRGLQAMVQRRKKLLKYLRRTDWDSYCLVLSKLGLRDNPDIKA